MPKKFIKKIEDFVCEHCGHEVKGSGFTNHCPKCLWSKHVDINPGDRINTCGGLMEPVGGKIKDGVWRLVHRCQKCLIIKENKLWPEDDFEEFTKIVVKGNKTGNN